MPREVVEPARAKTNLRLRVLGRGEDGYHALESVFLRLALADEVRLRTGDAASGEGIGLEVEAAPPDAAADDAVAEGGDPEQGSLFAPGGAEGADGDAAGRDGAGAAGEPGDGSDGDGSGEPPVGPAAVPGGPDNLCWRAAEAFFRAVGEEPAVAIGLRKRVPAAAGLGGGSADAAAVLRGLARLHPEPPPEEELMALAGELGSDVPFALLDRPVALGWERGRRLLPLSAPDPRPMLLLVPDVRVATPEAFGWLDEHRGGGAPDGAGPAEDGGEDPGRGGPVADGSPARHPAAALPPAAELAGWESLLAVAGNDFEEPVFARHPELGWWKEELLGEGADAALLCGSGSALCGIFSDLRRRDAAARRLREGADVGVVATRGPV